MNKNYTTVERIIAKIDNDFNPNNSDWIPRVPAWCIDAMQQLDVVSTKKVKKKLTVKDGVARSACCLRGLDLTVYDKNGCVIKNSENASSSCCGGNHSFTGEDTKNNTFAHIPVTPQTVDLEKSLNEETVAVIAQRINSKDYPARYNVKEIYKTYDGKEKSYTISGDFTIELNFDADYIFIEYDTIETIEGADGEQYPIIPNNGKLIEAIVYYCMYKMLCRGYKHPVFNLQASQYGTNPYYIWTSSKEEAKRSVINNGVNEDVSKLFRSSLFISSFYPRG